MNNDALTVRLPLKDEEIQMNSLYQWRCNISKECTVEALLSIRESYCVFTVKECQKGGGVGHSLLTFGLNKHGELTNVSGLLARNISQEKEKLLSVFNNLVSGVHYEKRSL